MASTYSKQDIDDMSERMRVNFVNSLSGFKSANLVGTRNAHGVNNLAMISSVFHLGAHPPLMGMVMRPHSVPRDTLQNIKDFGCYTINHVNESFVAKAHQCAARYAPDVSEFEQVGLNAQNAQCIDAPYVTESSIKIALQLEQMIKVSANNTEIVIGRIVEVNLPDNIVLNDGYIDIEKSKSVAVSGLDSYHSTKRIDRFSYAKPEQKPTSIW